jgi:hypothetical protein
LVEGGVVPADYYPGSKQLRRQYQDLPARAGEAEQPEVLGTPRTFTVGERDVEVYSVGDLARNLGRKAVSIRRWEQEGIIPLAPFYKRGIGNDPRGQRRYYSRAHVEGIVRIAREEGILDDLRKIIATTKFTDRVHQLFKELTKQ